MHIEVAKHAGFCWGVQRAMDVALETSVRFGHRMPVQTLGPLIHNPQAIDQLQRRGISEVENVEDAASGAVVIRAHGAPSADLKQLTDRRRNKELRIANGTCPEVARVQSLIRQHAGKGWFVIILGQPTHAEVVAHTSFALHGCAVIQTPQEAQDLTIPGQMPVLVVAQTTFSAQSFDTITDCLRTKGTALTVINTICPDTLVRQTEARQLARRVDTIVVVGGKASNNTRHLMEIAREEGTPVHWVEGASDLDIPSLQSSASIGVLAGASTPTWTVDEVVRVLEQASGRSAWAKAFHETVQITHFYEGIGLGLLALAFQVMLGGPKPWTAAGLPAAFHIGLCTLWPYLDPAGLGAKGHLRAMFLQQHRRSLLAFGIASLCLAFGSAWWIGTSPFIASSLLAILVLLYRRGMIPSPLRRLPGREDLGQAFLAAFLAVGIPWTSSINAKWNTLAIGFLAVAFLALAYHSWRHIWVFRENRIVGKELVPVLIGSHATRWLSRVLCMTSLGLTAWLLKY